ncbi:hypothetical protein PISMIDRAFT_686757 [Pisolithus microcarpus 441]|uniref:Uncharacterized protein n=1 Tax=Pisolithus microcarpus 441 TaxID=765257 RepID=A0A0C9Z890_9AGAM|nr:hypothetical protein PISMIDRAFT_686757 [Pisolithus microcarpus 441]
MFRSFHSIPFPHGQPGSNRICLDFGSHLTLADNHAIQVLKSYVTRVTRQQHHSLFP